MILREALSEEGLEGDGQRIKALGPGKGFRDRPVFKYLFLLHNF
jgi:hypothetical protein